MSELTVGPELDAEVAKACGDRVGAHDWEAVASNHEGSMYCCKHCGDTVLCDCFELELGGNDCCKRYSTDSNAAIEAGKRSGLLNGDYAIWYDPFSGWHVLPVGEVGELRRGSRGDDTLSGAICNAILALSEKSHGEAK